MTASAEECPIGVLVDLNEDVSISNTSKKAVKWLSAKKNEEIYAENFESHSILDISPSKIFKQLKKFKLSHIEPKELIVKSDQSSADCPTGVLVDVPSPSFLKGPRSYLDLRETEYQKSHKRYRCLYGPPSPQSMSRITKEASKVIDSLKSAISEEDTLLSEEKSPIPINFDLDSDDETTQSLDVGHVSQSEIQDESIVNEQTQKAVNVKVKDRKMTSKSGNFFDNALSAINDSNHSLDVSVKELNNNLTELCVSDYIDDVFIQKDKSIEDKENKLDNKKILLKDGAKRASESEFLNRPNVVHRGTLRNLSNVNHKTTTAYTSPAVSVNIPPNKVNNLLTPKESLSCEKQSAKTSAAINQSRMKPVRFSAIGQQSKTSKHVKTESSLKDDFEKSCRRQNIHMEEIPRRYSLCRLMKSSFEMNPPKTPRHGSATTNFHPSLSLSGGQRLSFSQSMSSDKLRYCSVESFKQPAAIGSTNSKGTFGMKTKPMTSAGIQAPRKTFIQQRQSFAHSMPNRSVMSTSSKTRFVSKLSMPSPLPAKQDKKLARNLFPALPKKREVQKM